MQKSVKRLYLTSRIRSKGKASAFFRDNPEIRTQNLAAAALLLEKRKKLLAGSGFIGFTPLCFIFGHREHRDIVEPPMKNLCHFFNRPTVLFLLSKHFNHAHNPLTQLRSVNRLGNIVISTVSKCS